MMEKIRKCVKDVGYGIWIDDWIGDGHVPELHMNQTNNMVEYPFHREHCACSVMNDVVEDERLLSAFVSHVEKEMPEQPSWGTYVQMKELLHYSHLKNYDNSHVDMHSLAVAMTWHWLQSVIANSQNSAPVNKAVYDIHVDIEKGGSVSMDDGFLSKRLHANLMEGKIHGISVWILISRQEGQEVPYHIDYAEWLRYRYNVIVPPMYAGTLHLSKDVYVGSGDFACQLSTYTHYEKYGYKGCKHSQHPNGGYTGIQVNDIMKDSSRKVYWDEFSKWLTVPYKYNRGIIMTGQLPHLSTATKPGMKEPRIVMGFNIFGVDVGRYVEEAPEHSAIFQQKVLQCRRRNMISIQSILSSSRFKDKLNKVQNREKLKQLQDQWTQGILEHFLENGNHTRLSCGDLIKILSLSTFMPNVNGLDIQYHIHKLITKCIPLVSYQDKNRLLYKLILTTRTEDVSISKMIPINATIQLVPYKE